MEKVPIGRMAQPFLVRLITVVGEDPPTLRPGHATTPWADVHLCSPKVWHHTPSAAWWRSGLGAVGQGQGLATCHPFAAFEQQTWWTTGMQACV